MSYEIIVGDCVKSMRAMPDNSVDSVVCDPPYELTSGGKTGFMGKAWDGSGIAFSVEMWAEALRVLKPGGHLLAFSGSRTYHRMACAIEDAGFDIRDQIMWVYGSGFPKSLDVSKAIDKARDDSAEGKAVGAWLKAQREARDLRQKDVAALWPSATGGLTGCVANWETMGKVPKWDQWLMLKAKIGFGDEMDTEVWRLNGRKGQPGEAWGEREVIGVQKGAMAGWSMDGGTKFVDRDITVPSSDAARQWEGWGTALKPAHEPICVARKPLIGTVAANVLQFGTGALNIDACRVGDEVRSYEPKGTSASAAMIRVPEHRAGKAGDEVTVTGRWPANLIHSGEAEVVACFPNENGKSAARFFMECKGGYNDICPNLNLPPSDALTAALNSSRPSQAVDSVLAHVASSALPEELHCSGLSPAPSTTATAADLRLLCESVTQAIQSIERKFWLESKPAKLTLTFNLASAAVQLDPTGTTTITISHWRSDGSAEPVTFNITRQNLEVGAKDSVPSTENSRLIYCAKASKADRGAENGHPTVKPTALMAYLVRLVTPPGGLVLDPFTGSGSTGKAAVREGFRFVGCELSPEYAAIAEARIADDLCGGLL